MAALQHVSASQVLEALSRRNQKELFFTGVKNGPTQVSGFGALKILDAVGIHPSWTMPQITGYEVKVSRSDWLRDQKWVDYLQYCHRFYLVAPSGVIQEVEIPDGVGYMIYAPKSSGLKVQRKATFRDIGEPDWLMLWYIILSKLEPDRWPFHSSAAEYWRTYLEDKHAKRDLGHHVSQKLRAELEELRKQADRQDHDADVGRAVRKLCGEFGLHVDSYGNHELRRRLESGIPREISWAINNLEMSLKALRQLAGKSVPAEAVEG